MPPVLRYATETFNANNCRADAAEAGRTSAQPPGSGLSCSTGHRRPTLAQSCDPVNTVLRRTMLLSPAAFAAAGSAGELSRLIKR